MPPHLASSPQSAHDEGCGQEWEQRSKINECHCSLAACCTQRTARSLGLLRASVRFSACGVSSI